MGQKWSPILEAFLRLWRCEALMAMDYCKVSTNLEINKDERIILNEQNKIFWLRCYISCVPVGAVRALESFNGCVAA